MQANIYKIAKNTMQVVEKASNVSNANYAKFAIIAQCVLCNKQKIKLKKIACALLPVNALVSATVHKGFAKVCYKCFAILHACKMPVQQNAISSARKRAGFTLQQCSALCGWGITTQRKLENVTHITQTQYAILQSVLPTLA